MQVVKRRTRGNKKRNGKNGKNEGKRELVKKRTREE